MRAISLVCVHAQKKSLSKVGRRLGRTVSRNSLYRVSLRNFAPNQKNKVRVGLVGAGPSGLSLLNAFNKELERLNEKNESPNFEIVCFEKQSAMGGLWNYSWQTDTDEYGEPVHGSMYSHLWSNGPKECLEMCDYPFAQHFDGQNIGSFPPRPVLKDYILGRAAANELANKFDIRLSHCVTNVQQDSATNKFKVCYKDLPNDVVGSEEFDYLVVASGHFSTPNIVSFDGFNTFRGRILHSHSFRNAHEFKDKNVLIIGSSYSGEDIALQCHKFGAKSVTVSYRTKPMQFKWPNGLKEVPLLKEIVNEKDAIFENGETLNDIDAIILCTGYLHSFPFLPDEMRLKTKNSLYPGQLYKGVKFIGNAANLFYLGMQDQWYTFSMFDVQSLYTKDVILDKVQLPNAEVMSKDAQTWCDKLDACEDDKQLIEFQTDYIVDLYESLDDGSEYIDDGANKLNCTDDFVQWKYDKKVNILTYRDQCFASKVTGITAVSNSTSWMDAFDDSLATYLTDCKATKGTADSARDSK